MRFIDKIIYLYLFICVSLLVFNFLYILRSTRVKKKEGSCTQRWEHELKTAILQVKNSGKASREHERLMKKKLSNIHELTAYYHALISSELALADEDFAVYLKVYQPVILELAWKYRKREPMERAFFAYLVSICFRCCQGTYTNLSEVLLSYLADSTVYCRENVFQALYTLGNAGAVGQAFDYISKKGWYHHPRLIADGLSNFRGDKEELVRHLWKRRRFFSEFLIVGIVQFATNVSGAFEQEFSAALEDEEEYLEVRLAVLRYFRRHPSEKVRPFLLRVLSQEGESVEFTIVAAFVASAYPGEETKTALKHALCSRNWYVRKNAAQSLGQLGITRKDREEIAAGGDKYANEILSYMAERGNT